jgi:CIC family chloride channel protein
MWGKVVSLMGRLPRRGRTLIETCVVGLAAGLAAVAFQAGIDALGSLIYNEAHWSSLRAFAIGSLGIICAAALLTRFLLNKLCPEAAGSGIPKLTLAFWRDFGDSPPHIALVKFVAGVVGIGGGLSLGREGPSVQIGGNLGSTVAGLLGVSKQGKRAAVAAGSAAALAAAFNAPLAGVAFVLEEILEDLNSRFLGPVLVAAVIGAFTVHAIIGPDPAFQLPRIDEPSWRAYLLMPVVATLAALIGVGFQQVTLALRARLRKASFGPASLHPVLGALVTWVLGMTVFGLTGKLGVFGIGYTDLSHALNNGLVWQVAGLLLVAKWLATIACYSSGGCGGIFSPCLFFGAMCGTVLTDWFGHALELSASDRVLLAVGGMSACLGAVVQAPVTAILIIFEMTHQFSLVPGLMLAGLLSQLVARRVVHANFYEAALLQDGHRMEQVVPPRDIRAWQNLPISAIANFDPVIVADLEPQTLREAIGNSYRRFPVTGTSGLMGILNRSEIEAALEEGRTPMLCRAIAVRPGQLVREVQGLLIESEEGMVVITDREGGTPLAVVTLHDLLRGQLAMAEREGAQ